LSHQNLLGELFLQFHVEVVLVPFSQLLLSSLVWWVENRRKSLLRNWKTLGCSSFFDLGWGLGVGHLRSSVNSCFTCVL
jgi:hypothetical protein